MSFVCVVFSHTRVCFFAIVCSNEACCATVRTLGIDLAATWNNVTHTRSLDEIVLSCSFFYGRYL